MPKLLQYAKGEIRRLVGTLPGPSLKRAIDFVFVEFKTLSCAKIAAQGGPRHHGAGAIAGFQENFCQGAK